MSSYADALREYLRQRRGYPDTVFAFSTQRAGRINGEMGQSQFPILTMPMMISLIPFLLTGYILKGVFG